MLGDRLHRIVMQSVVLPHDDRVWEISLAHESDLVQDTVLQLVDLDDSLTVHWDLTC